MWPRPLALVLDYLVVNDAETLDLACLLPPWCFAKGQSLSLVGLSLPSLPKFCLSCSMAIIGSRAKSCATVNWLSLATSKSHMYLLLCYIPSRQISNCIPWWKLTHHFTQHLPLASPNGWHISQHNVLVLIFYPCILGINLIWSSSGVDTAHINLCDQTAAQAQSERFLAIVQSSCLGQQMADLDCLSSFPWISHCPEFYQIFSLVKIQYVKEKILNLPDPWKNQVKITCFFPLQTAPKLHSSLFLCMFSCRNTQSGAKPYLTWLKFGTSNCDLLKKNSNSTQFMLWILRL